MGPVGVTWVGEGLAVWQFGTSLSFAALVTGNFERRRATDGMAHP